MNKALQSIIAIGVIVTLMFAAFGVRIILQANGINLPGAKQQQAEEEVAEEETQSPEAADEEVAKEEPMDGMDQSEPPIGVRPTYVPRSEEVARASRNLQEQEQALARRSEQMDRDQDFLDLVYTDFLSERTSIEEKRALIERELESALQRSNGEIERLREEVAAMKQENADLRQQHAEDLARLTDDRSMTELKNYKKMGSIFDSVKPENVAAIFVELATNAEAGIETIVGIIYQMKERQAAKVLNALREVDPDLAAELVTQLKLRRPAERATDLLAP